MTKPVQLDNILAKLDVKRGMSVIRAIQNTREYIDNQSDPQKAANGLLLKLGVAVPFINDLNKARIFAMTTVEQAVKTNSINPEQVIAKAEQSFDSLSKQSMFAKPEAPVIEGKPKSGDGFIALSSIDTPEGCVRLSSPLSLSEYARDLYSALRRGDKQDLKRIYVSIPEGDGIAIVIRERMTKAAR